MKIAVIGANGQLGKDICEKIVIANNELIELNHDRIETSNIECVSYVLKEVKPDVVINTAAMHNVEKCENDPERSFKVNGIGARNLSNICNDLNSTLIHISTDYVFDGSKNKPYIEIDKPLPLNVYGNTKLSGEYFIESIAKKYFILRVSGIYGKNPCRAKGTNFVDLMLKLAKERDEIRVVDNEILTPTFTEDIADQIVKILNMDAEYGLYHVTAEGSCSWFEFAREIFSVSKTNIVLNRAAPGEFAIKVNRPKYSVLENKFLNDQNINIMPLWKDGLTRYLNKT